MTFATTWDEPWQDEVMKEADSFVYAKIKSYDGEEGVKINIIKTLGGEELSGEIEITDFYLLHLCSISEGYGPEFHFNGIKECYFFIKKNKKGDYCIATPTAGFAPVIKFKIYATYRHSYHQAEVDQDIYEMTMTAIFNHYHNKAYRRKDIDRFVSKYTKLDPAGFEAPETFFNQHVAMESIYHLGLEGYSAKMIPFLKDTSNFHNQVSAARALSAENTKTAKDALMNAISNEYFGEFVKVICVWSLSKLDPVDLKSSLVDAEKNASDESNDFGGNIMDPRVCTGLPSLKEALSDLIAQL